MAEITTFLMFEGQAEEAMSKYVSLFSDSEINHIVRYGADEAGKEGTVYQATFTLNGQTFMCTDSFIEHDFTFTPSMSLFVKCSSEEEVDRVFHALSKNGEVLMPLDTYPFSKRFGWVSDQYGVSWQLSLEQE